VAVENYPLRRLGGAGGYVVLLKGKSARVESAKVWRWRLMLVGDDKEVGGVAGGNPGWAG